MDSSHYNNVCGLLFSTYVDEVTEESNARMAHRGENQYAPGTVNVNTSMTPGFDRFPVEV